MELRMLLPLPLMMSKRVGKDRMKEKGEGEGRYMKYLNILDLYITKSLKRVTTVLVRFMSISSYSIPSLFRLPLPCVLLLSDGEVVGEGNQADK